MSTSQRRTNSTKGGEYSARLAVLEEQIAGLRKELRDLRDYLSNEYTKHLEERIKFLDKRIEALEKSHQAIEARLVDITKKIFYAMGATAAITFVSALAATLLSGVI